MTKGTSNESFWWRFCTSVLTQNMPFLRSSNIMAYTTERTYDIVCSFSPIFVEKMTVGFFEFRKCHLAFTFIPEILRKATLKTPRLLSVFACKYFLLGVHFFITSFCTLDLHNSTVVNVFMTDLYGRNEEQRRTKFYRDPFGISPKQALFLRNSNA